MKKISELIKFQLKIFFKENKLVMPFAFIIIFQYVMYSIKPLGIVDSFSMTCYLIFFIMVWIGFGVSAGENEVTEQVQLLRIQSARTYYLAKVFFLMIIGLGVNIICLLCTVIQNLVNQNELFLRPLTAFDILNAFILLCGSAFLGGEMGSLLHPRIIHDKKLSLILTFLYVLLTIIKVPLEQEVPFFLLISWMIPSLSQISVKYSGTDVFFIWQTIYIFGSLLCYGIIFAIIRTVLCNKKKF